MHDNFFSEAHELTQRGEPFVTAMVVRAERPTSAKPGDKAIVTGDGTLHGWVGGSCAQPTVLAEAKRALADGQPRLIRLSTEPDGQAPRAGLTDLPMTCFSGGTLEIYLEPQIPTPRLLVVGGAPIAHALVRLGKLMGYHVVAADLDSAPNDDASAPIDDERLGDLSRLPELVTPATYAVVASHGSYDEIALGYLLRARPAYVALVSSKTRAKAVLAYLADEGIAPDVLGLLKYPAGLDIHAAGAEEIAVSIMAEIIQRRHAAAGGAVATQAESVPEVITLAPPEAIDPVCGMSVRIDGARFSYEYEGQMYYFCCPGCRKSFASEPEHYLVKR